MANFRVTLTGNTTGTLLCYITKPRALTEYFATLNAYGTFGGGTLSYGISTDGGATIVTQKDLSGVAYSATSNDTVNIMMGVANHNGQEPRLYAILAGSTAPSITIDVEDNT